MAATSTEDAAPQRKKADLIETHRVARATPPPSSRLLLLLLQLTAASSQSPSRVSPWQGSSCVTLEHELRIVCGARKPSPGQKLSLLGCRQSLRSNKTHDCSARYIGSLLILDYSTSLPRYHPASVHVHTSHQLLMKMSERADRTLQPLSLLQDPSTRYIGGERVR